MPTRSFSSPASEAKTGGGGGSQAKRRDLTVGASAAGMIGRARLQLIPNPYFFVANISSSRAAVPATRSKRG
jgi:hypothetical protein